MKQKFFTEILPIYKSKKNNPYTIRIRMRIMSTVDYSVLRCAVDTTAAVYLKLMQIASLKHFVSSSQ